MRLLFLVHCERKEASEGSFIDKTSKLSLVVNSENRMYELTPFEVSETLSMFIGRAVFLTPILLLHLSLQLVFWQKNV
jgi:hypothetical protein